MRAQQLTPIPSLQFDFTSCQGVIFVLLMTLFFSGLILAILLPFQYVSPGSPGGTPGREGEPTLPKGALSSHTLQGRPRAKGLQPAILSNPPGTCPGLVGSISKQTGRLFLAGLGTCLHHEPHPASPFSSSP